MSPLLPDHGKLPVQEMSTGTLQQVHPSPSSTEKSKFHKCRRPDDKHTQGYRCIL